MLKLELPEHLVTVVMEALAKQPLAVSFDAFVSIRNQVTAQRMPPLEAPPPPPKDTGGIAHQTNGDARE